MPLELCIENPLECRHCPLYEFLSEIGMIVHLVYYFYTCTYIDTGTAYGIIWICRE